MDFQGRAGVHERIEEFASRIVPEIILSTLRRIDEEIFLTILFAALAFVCVLRMTERAAAQGRKPATPQLRLSLTRKESRAREVSVER